MPGLTQTVPRSARGMTPASALALALALLPAAFPASADELPMLWGDYSAATEKAQREGRLLLVVDLSGDFTARGIAGEEGAAYQTLAFDSRVRELLRERFVATFRPVGMPASLNLVSERGKLKKAEPDPQHAVAYICLPDERVIHFVPGFVTADQLLPELLWAEECYCDFVRFPRTEQAAAVRQMHLAAADVELLLKGTDSRWLLDKPTREYNCDQLISSIRTVRQLRLRSLDERFAGDQNSLPARVFYEALADHGSLEATYSHAVLAEFPLPPLADLARPLYEIWFGDDYWRLSPRRSELKEWLTARIGTGKPILLAVTGSRTRPVDVESRRLIAWPPPADSDLPLAEFEVLELSLDELVSLNADAALAPLSAKRQELPRFVVYDRAGRRRAVLSSRDGIAKLRVAMRASSMPGVAATSKGKKRDK